MIFLALVLTISAPTIFKWFIGEKYAQAVGYVFWISMGFAFNGMYKMVVNYFFYMKSTFLVSLATFFTAGINIVLNYYLISAYGPIGAAQATAVSFLVQFLLVWLLASKMYKMPWTYYFSLKKER
jgi:O-antigen/teichoic acid export membrane protein